FRVPPPRVEALREPVEHHEPLGTYRRDRREPAVAYEDPKHAGHVLRCVVVLGRSGRALRLGTRREPEGLAEQVQGAVLLPDDQPGVDESLHAPPGGPRGQAGVALNALDRRGTEYQRR